MGNFIVTEDKVDKNAEKSVEKSSFDVEENKKNNNGFPEFWPVDGKVYGKIRREPYREIQIYCRGPVVSDSYLSKTAIISKMYVHFQEGKF